MAVTDYERGTTFYGLNADRPSVPDNMGQAWISYDTGDHYIASNIESGGIAWCLVFPSAVDYVQFDTSYVPSGHSPGRLYWDSAEGTLTLDMDGSEVKLQLGKELAQKVWNQTGSTILNGKALAINNTTPVYNGMLNVILAKADAQTTTGIIGLATEDIPNDSGGYFTHKGEVNDIDTSAWAEGSILYLSDVTAGELTDTKPIEPSYNRLVGRVTASDATVGSIVLWIQNLPTFFDLSQYTQDLLGTHNGMAVGVTPDVTVSSNGSTITLSVEATGGGVIPVKFSTGFYVWDTDPADTIALNAAGSDTVPVRNYVYLLESTKTLTVSTTGWPAGEHMAIADVICQTAATVQTSGCLKVHVWTDHTAGTDNMGHISHINSWIRHQPTTWLSGVDPSFTGTGTGTINMSTLAGYCLQLHPHVFPSFSSPAPLHVINDLATPYTQTTNIANILYDATGASLNNKYYVLVIWGVISEDSGDCQLMCNLPSGSYTTSYDAARQDVSGYTNYAIPSDYEGVGFLIYRLVMRNQASATWYYDIGDDDLRGKKAGNIAGTSAVVITDFPDGSSGLTVYDDADDTHKAQFDCGTLTTTRTFTYPDASGTFVLTADLLNYVLLAGRAGDKIVMADSATTPPLNMTERSAAPSSPSSGDMYLDDGTNTSSGLPGWRRYTGSAWENIAAITSSSNALPQGHIQGFEVSCNGSTLTITPGISRNDSDTVNLKRTTSSGNLTIDPSGTGAGGIDANDSALAASTWYRVYIIAYSDGSNIAGFLSTSASPTLPGSYAVKRRIGWALTDGSAVLYKFQTANNSGTDRQIDWYESTNSSPFKIWTNQNLTPSGWDTADLSGVIPSTGRQANLQGNTVGATGSSGYIIYRVDSNDGTHVLFRQQVSSSNNASGIYSISSSQTMDFGGVSGSVENFNLSISGYVDDLSVDIV